MKTTINQLKIIFDRKIIEFILKSFPTNLDHDKNIPVSKIKKLLVMQAQLLNLSNNVRLESYTIES